MVRPHVLHLMRGQVFDIGGLTWFTMGGAASHDIDDGILNPAEPDFEHKYWKMRRMGAYFRVLGHAWWTEEMPGEAEYAETEANLEQVGWSADCVLTHCASTGVAKAAGPGYQPDRLTDFLESVKERRQFSRWFCGHYRTNRVVGEQFNTLHAMVIKHDGSDAARSALDAAMAELFVDHLSTGDVALLPLFHLGRGGVAFIRGRLRLGPLRFGLEVELGFRLEWLPAQKLAVNQEQGAVIAAVQHRRPLLAVPGNFQQVVVLVVVVRQHHFLHGSTLYIAGAHMLGSSALAALDERVCRFHYRK